MLTLAPCWSIERETKCGALFKYHQTLVRFPLSVIGMYKINRSDYNGWTIKL